MRKEARKKYPHLYEKYKEANRIYSREYYYKNREKILNKRRGNKDFLAKKRIYFTKWKRKNKERYYNSIFEWGKTANGIYSRIKNRCKNKKDEKHRLEITRDEFIDWWGRQEQRCAYCGLTIKQINKLPDWYVRRSGKYHLSIDRKDSQKGYSLDNIVLACYMCNTMKNSFLSYEEMKKVGEVVLKPKLAKMLKNTKND